MFWVIKEIIIELLQRFRKLESQVTLVVTCCSIIFVLILLALYFRGCQAGGLNLIPVTGRITFNGGEWKNEGMIFFVPVDPAKGYPTRAGMARFNRDGEFVATTFKENDGLIPGRYFVNLECWAEQEIENSSSRKSLIPEKFQNGSESGLELNVSPSAWGGMTVNFDIPAQFN